MPSSANIRHIGVIQQHSATMIWIGRLVDALIVFLTFYFVVRYFGSGWNANHLVVAIIWILSFEAATSFFHVYHSWRTVRLRHELSKIAAFWLICTAWLSFVLYALSDTVIVEKHTVYIWLMISFALVCLSRIAVRLFLRFARASGYDTRKVAFFGASEMSRSLIETFESHAWMGMNVVGTFDDSAPGDEQDQDSTVELAGDLDALVNLAQKGEVDIIYISLALTDEKRITELIKQFADSTVSICYCPSFFNFELINARWDNVFGQPVFRLVDTPFRGRRRLLKNTVETLLLLLLGPFVLIALLFLSAMVLVTSGRPVFYKQFRYGIDGKPFMMWKFRTMDQDSCNEEYARARKNDQRVTWFGAILRKTSLDELPQFINVLRGEMSIIGPRPHPNVVNEELRKSIHRYMFRHKIKPGITGLAQVSGYRGESKNLDHMQKRLEFDLHYIKNWSLSMDMKILFRTLFSVTGKNVY